MAEPTVRAAPVAIAMQRSPFEGHAAQTQPSRAGGVGVHLQAHTLAGVLLIATWPAAIAALEQALAQALGLAAVPLRTGRTMPLGAVPFGGGASGAMLARHGQAGAKAVIGAVTGAVAGAGRAPGGNVLMRSGPFEFLLVCDGAAPTVDALRTHVRSDIGSVTDIGHARCRIRISGDQCQAVLAKLFALDQRPAAFPHGELRLSGHHHVPCLLHRLEPDAFDLYVFTTYAHDQLGTLLEAAREYGVALALGQA